MKKTYEIEIDCANCANLVEGVVSKMEGIVSCTVNFMTQKMIVEYAEDVNIKKTEKAILKAGRKVEPDFDMEL